MSIIRHEARENHAPNLLPQHRADLRASGLTDATIAACGFYSQTNPRAVAALLGIYWKPTRAARLGPCLVIPYFGPAGEPMTYANGDGTAHPFVRLKPDRPRADRKKAGKTVKYESPGKTPCRA